MKWFHQATVGSTPFGTAEWSPPVVVNGVVYATSNADTIDDNLYAFDAVSGRKIWSNSVEGPTPYALTVVNSTIYMSSLNSVVSAFDTVSGHEKWSYATRAVIQSSPTTVNGIVYVGANDGTLHAIFS